MIKRLIWTTWRAPLGSFHDGLGFISCFFIHIMVCVKVLKKWIETETECSLFCRHFQINFYPRPALAFGYCHCLCLCVCVSCLCVNHLLVRVITWDPFKLGSPNLDQRCKMPWLRSLLFCRVINTWPSRSNLTLKSKFTQFLLVHTIITHSS